MHCHLNLRYMTLGQGHDTPLGHGQKMYEILSRSIIAVRSYDPDKDFGYAYTVTLVQSHDTTLCHGQQLCDILSRSIMAVRSYDPDKDLGYVCTVTLTLEI